MTKLTLHTKNIQDISSWSRRSVGFDPLMQRMMTHMANDTYPPFNVIRYDDDNYAVQVAVAGFTKEELSVTVKEGHLIVQTEEIIEEEVPSIEFLHQGISSRHFRREWELADHVVVKSAALTNGLLDIRLERKIPEELKPKIIKIK